MSVGGQANAGGRERVHLGFKDEFCLLVMGKSFNLRMGRGNFYLIGLQGKLALWGKSGDASPNCSSLPLFVWLRSVRGCTLCPRWPKLPQEGVWTASEAQSARSSTPPFTGVPALANLKHGQLHLQRNCNLQVKGRHDLSAGKFCTMAGHGKDRPIPKAPTCSPKISFL